MAEATALATTSQTSPASTPACQQHRQKPRNRHQPEPERDADPPEIEARIQKLAHRPQGGAVLVIGMGEELDGFDVGDRWQALADVAAGNNDGHSLVFTDLHHIIAPVSYTHLTLPTT